MGQLGNTALAVVMGAAVAVYFPMLALGGRIVGSPVLFNICFFGLGVLTSVVIFFFVTGGRLADFGRFADVPWWLYASGIISGLMILGTSYLIPRIGPGPYFLLLVTGQILMGAVISQFALIGMPHDPMTLKKVAGIVAVLAGAWLVTAK